MCVLIYNVGDARHDSVEFMFFHDFEIQSIHQY